MRRLPLLLLLALAACGQQAQQVDAPTAPTTVPLGSPQGTAPTAAVPSAVIATTAPIGAAPTVPAATTVPVTATAAPAPTAPVTPAAQPIAAPTRVVPPADAIALPEGFGISVFAEKLRGPRMLALGPDGALYAAERAGGRIVRLPDADRDGVSDATETVAGELESPSSLAFHPDGSLYVAETTRVLRLSQPDGQGGYQTRETIIDGLPEGGHNTRTLLFSRDAKTLYVAVGSSCNVCVEGDERRAAIVAYDAGGGNQRLHARGLRNAVGIVLRPGTDEIWATNNGRDMLGDDQPPENVYAVPAAGLDFGWPACHSGRIVDPEFGGADGCAGVEQPVVEMQAHSAPLGLAFGAATNFPEPYRGGLFVAFHGSWNRSQPTGYKLVFIPLDGAKAGPPQDFATGWLKEDGTVWGRPVDALPGPDGSLYVSDDAGGIIYRIFRAAP